MVASYKKQQNGCRASMPRSKQLRMASQSGVIVAGNVTCCSGGKTRVGASKLNPDVAVSAANGKGTRRPDQNWNRILRESG